MKEYDSQYLQRAIEQSLDDLENEDERAVAEWILSRLNQSHPDGDVDKQTVINLASDPRIRESAININLDDFINYLWM